MQYSYWQLKEALGLGTTPFLSAFERYCEEMRSNTRVLEWSCKVRGGEFEGGRFLHTARSRDLAEAKVALDHLYATVFAGGEAAESGPDLLSWLRPLAERIGRGIAVGYAENGSPHRKQSELKLYVTTTAVRTVTPLIALIVPPHATPPANTAKVMIAASMNDRRVRGFRVYYLWERATMGEASATEWFTRWCSPEEIDLIERCGSRTVSIAFKEGVRDMLYLSVPFNHPWIDQLVSDQLGSHPITRAQLDYIRWIGLSKRGEGRQSQELNFYFGSYFP